MLLKPKIQNASTTHFLSEKRTTVHLNFEVLIVAKHGV